MTPQKTETFSPNIYTPFSVSFFIYKNRKNKQINKNQSPDSQIRTLKTEQKQSKTKRKKEMSCTVAISTNSPVFSPSSRVSSSLFCKSSPEKLSPSSGLKLRLQKPPTPSGLIRASIDEGSSPTLLKRKRPARLDIPVANLGICGVPPTVEERRVEDEGDGYSVYCKRGRRETMEDRYSAVVDDKQVCLE